jgi:hypothetical protein
VIFRSGLDPRTRVAVLAIAVGVAAVSGSSLPLKLRNAIITGPIGLVLLFSAVIDKPLLAVLMRRVARHEPDRAPRIEATLRSDRGRHVFRVLTAIAGLTLVADAAGQVILALSVSTSSFVATARVVRWVTIGAGIATAVAYVRRVRAQVSPHSPPAADPAEMAGRR